MTSYNDEHSGIHCEVDDVSNFKGYKIYGNPLGDTMLEKNDEPTHESELIGASLSISCLTYSTHLFEYPFSLDYINVSFLKCDDKLFKD